MYVYPQKKKLFTIKNHVSNCIGIVFQERRMSMNKLQEKS